MYKKSFFIGLIIGIINLISLSITMSLGPDDAMLKYYNELEILGYSIIFLLLLVGIYFAIQQTKIYLESDLSFKEAFISGLVVSLVSGVFGLITNYVAYKVLMSPDTISQLMEGYEAQRIASGVSPTDAKTEVEMMSGPLGVWISGLLYVLNFWLIGAVISIVFAAIPTLRKYPNSSEEIYSE